MILVSLMMKKLITMDYMLDAHAPHIHPKLPLPQAIAFETAAFDALALLTAVADHYMRVDPKPLFNITIKAHYLVHIAVNARYLNPRLAMCYSGEDYMHHMKRCVAMAIRGTKATLVGKKMSDKQRHAWHQEMMR